MAFEYPPKPWRDGQTLRRDMSDGTVLIGQYDLTKNLWHFARTTPDASSRIVTTADVFTLNERPDTGTNPFNLTDEPGTVVTQQEANWWLFEDLAKRQRKVVVQDSAPPNHPLYNTIEATFIDGDLWYDTSLLEMFIYWQGAWFPTSAPPADYDLEIEQFQYGLNRLQELLDEIYLKNVQQDERLDDINNAIIELEEEIDALAPSTERGAWRLNLVGSVGQPGQFTMYDGAFGVPDIGPIGKVKEVESIWFNELDSDNTPHGFAGVEEGDLLELFVDGSPEYGLWSVVGTPHYETAGPASFWVIDVNFQRTLEDNTTFGPGELCRLKIFKAPEGGNASEFVRKTGDTMSGDLAIDKSNDPSADVEVKLELKGSRPSTSDSAATIKFTNDQSTTSGFLSYRSYGAASWFGFNQDVDLGNNGLHSVAQIRMQSGGYIGSGTSQRIKVRSGNTNDAGTEIQRPGDGKRTFAIKGKAAGTSSTSDFFWAYGNSGSGGDAINYTGKTTEDNHIATKKYVDSKLPTYTITKSGGNYYVS